MRLSFRMEMIALKELSYKDAQLIIENIMAELLIRGKAAVVAVADRHGELIALTRMDGAPLPSIVNAGNKAWTAARERKPSAAVGQAARDPVSGFDIGYYGDPRYTGWGGGIPILHGGEVVGAVAVSGLVESEDIELAQLGADSAKL
jgi:glc operon protein GlcG